MLNRCGVGCAVGLAVGVLLHGRALADERPWVWTYGSAMMAPGEAELESYLTLQSVDWARREANLRSVHQIELEIGMTERLDIAIYQSFSRSPGVALDWDGFKLRGRWRLLRDAKAFAHPLLYVEYKNNASLTKEIWEGKLLLAERFGRLSAALNPVLEVEEGELESGVNAGLSWALGPLLSMGGELRVTEDGARLGPVLSHGADGLWTALGLSWPLGKVDPGVSSHEIRLILGVNLRE